MPFRHSSTAKRVTIVVALLGVLGIAAGFALAADALQAPSINSGPPTLTNSTSASFTFSESKSVTFQCSLDAAAFANCGTGKTGSISYSGPLGQGSHTFHVRAQSGSLTSSATSYTWTIDTTKPVVTAISRAGANPTNATAVQWTVTFSKSVTGVATSNFSLVASGLSGTAAITGVTGSGSTYTVSASTGTLTPSGSGTLQLRLSSAGAIKDLAGNPLGGTIPFNGDTYTIDKTPPPVPSITSKPANPTNQTTAAFGFTDAESGVTYLCRLDGGSFSSCTSPKSYSGLGGGTHTFYVEAQDAAGNVSSPASSSWLIDLTPPPPPAISQHPSDPTTASSATFKFTDGEAAATFECKLDSGSYSACSSGITYTGLTAGQHNFYVRAVDPVGNRSGATQFEWDVTQTTGQPFMISGSAPSTLYPGAPAQQLPVKLSNPNNVPIFVTALTATVSSTGLPAGCGTANFAIVQSTISGAGVQVPANGSVTLPQPNGTPPAIQMIDTHTNQDACKNATVTITYGGSAHS